MREITRRRFIQGSAGALALTMFTLRPREAGADARATMLGATDVAYRTWQDVYREKWTWDRIAKGAHHVLNCVSACPFNLYIKDGIVWREEQNPIMNANREGLPDFNPRGCQKGACFSQLMYGESRLKHPLKRVGERGEGKWKRITWDEALDEITDKMIEIAVESGPECIVRDCGTANEGYGAASFGEMRLFELMGTTQLDGWGGAGDMPLGVVMTWGLFNTDGTSDDYFNSDLIFLWLANPSYTRIPDAHFFWEARYNGTKVVSIAPDYNPSTMHCDQWVNVRIGTDAALALGMAHVLVHENLYKEDYVKEQTDMPILVREDTREFLRQADVKKGGKQNVFYVWDQRKSRIAEAPGSEGLGRSTSLHMGDLDPALRGRFDVTLVDGKTVSVRPVFESLLERLEDYTPEKAAAIVGVGADTIRELAREMGRAKAVSMMGSWGMMKHHHSDLFQRSMILLLALTGNVGKRGAGMKIGAWYTLTGNEWIGTGGGPKWYEKLAMKLIKPTIRELISYFREYEKDQSWIPQFMFLYEHGGLKEVVDKPSYHDAKPGMPLPEATRESIEKGWMPMFPRLGKTPRMYIHTRVNPLRRWALPQVAERNLWPKFELIVGMNLRMTTTTMKSDIVLPAAGYYEQRNIKYAQSYVPYLVVGDKAVEALGESRTEWDVWGEVAKILERKAKERGVGPVIDGREVKRDYTKLYDEWTHGHMFTHENDDKFYEVVTAKSPEVGHVSWDEAVTKGAVPIKKLPEFRTHTNFCSDWEPGDTVYSCQWFTELKKPWPTLTGRQQFYLDHPWFIAADEHLPIHKEPPMIGGDYPMLLTGGHTRWSIHSTWRDEKHMLRLQRGEPSAWIGVDDAETRGISDGDRIRIFNDEGSFQLIAKVSPSVQPGQVIVYHAWEPLQFKDWKGQQEPVSSTWKSLHLAEYGQLHYRFVYGGPHHAPRAMTVEVERV